MADDTGFRSWPAWALILFGLGASAGASVLFNVAQSADVATALRVVAGLAGAVVCVFGLVVVFRWASAADRRKT